jgi:carboxyl-terminal processing protease
MRLKSLAFATVAATLVPVATAQDACPVFFAPLGVADHGLTTKERREIFLRAWEEVNDHFYDPALLTKVNWAAARERFVQRALGAPTDPAFYAVLNEMMAVAAPSTDQFVWTKAQADFYLRGAMEPGNLGLFVEGDPSGVRVRELMKGAGADAAGLRKGDVLTAVNGERCFGFEPLRGPVGTPVTVTVQGGDGQLREVEAKRTNLIEPPQHPTARLGKDGSVGYVFVTTAAWENIAATFDKALETLLATGVPQGIILDLRGMNGYSSSNVEGILGEFIIGHLGGYANRRNSQDGIIARPGKHYEQLSKVPMVVLVDEDTVADGEAIAAILQATGRAKVIGSKTLGRVLLTDFYNLPDGGAIGVATQQFVLRDGTRLQGHGVTPDLPVAGHWHDFASAASDPVIAKALESLQGR